MPPSHRRFLLIDNGLVPGIINFILNGLIIWALYRGVPEVPLWGEPSYAVDLVITAFLLPFLTGLIVGPLVPPQVRQGKVAALPGAVFPLAGMARRGVLVRSLLLGLMGVIFAAVPMVWLLDMANAQPLATMSYVWFKAIWAGMLAAVITPFAAWWGLLVGSQSSE